MMAEPGKLFQPTKAVATLGGFAKDVAVAGVESAKTLATDTIGLATGAVGDMLQMGKDVANIWTEPQTGEGLFQPKKPLEELTSIGSKVLKS
ncbi:MAG: hypothetical protein LBP53_07360 [Candidatus Peribacteria bacterium]|jgi:hypothetical protein|nr:hypothetical protein [Candidatus Peribacteria bacterium]